jgi:formylglycine-generating enzyme required for sulfatase activity
MQPIPVGSYPPNAWGLHDMHGNVWEWCADWADLRMNDQGEICMIDYPQGDLVDPRGPATEPECGGYRVLRGGSCDVFASSISSARRFYAVGCGRGSLRVRQRPAIYLGFRPVVDVHAL